MSYENYIKNKDVVEDLISNYIDLYKDGLVKLIYRLAKASIYTVHCRCCEDVYNDSGDNIIKRHGDCKCGSCRTSIYDTNAAFVYGYYPSLPS